MQRSLANITALSLLMFILVGCSQPVADRETATTVEAPKYAMVIHGGAGSASRENLSAETDSLYRAAINHALDLGERILSKGGSSLDAIEAAIKSMENDSMFNAGRGAVFTHDAINSLDASIMEGAGMMAGAVAGVTNIKNPISAARAVMERSDHVLLSGNGAEEFAKYNNLEMVDPAYFRTQKNLDRLNHILKQEEESGVITGFSDWKYGTVGAVALDEYGNIAAGTSTGGMTNKRWGRIGDSPIVGAGTYADNAYAGVSCTGHGEFYIRYAVAHDVIAKMKYAELSVEEACQKIIHDELKMVKGAGGIIALDAKGNVSMEFNTQGMPRGYIRPGERVVAIYGDE